MPATSPQGQPAPAVLDWFGSANGKALLDSEYPALVERLGASRGLPWLWLGPRASDAHARPAGRGLRLFGEEGGWIGEVKCALPLPIAGESIGCIVLQHVLTRSDAGTVLLAECERVLVPGGQLVVFALNPLAPYRLRWRGAGLGAAEPLVWRRRLRAAGLTPQPLSQGIGPSWRVAIRPELQQGAGLRAAYLLLAEKRSLPLTPTRAAKRLAPAVPIAALAAMRDGATQCE